MSAAARMPFAPPAPRLLVPERSAPLRYPVETLGPVLADFVRATVEATQCAEATAAQSGLAAACLAAQAHADVITPAGLARPLSLYLITIAASGERKSAADFYALQPIREIEADEREAYRREHHAWRNRHDGWEAQRGKIKRDRTTDAGQKRDALGALGLEPLPPLRPERTVEDATAEGLIKSWADCHGSRGLFTAEGAKVIAGHSMSPEARLRTAATYSGLWDDGHAERIRAGDGFLSLLGRRMAVHLMAQPGVAAALIGAADMEDQGFLGRFLICEAPEKAGSRFFRDPPGARDHRFAAYRSALRRLMMKAPATKDGRNELDPRIVSFSPDARTVWIELHDEIEAKLGSRGELGGVKSFGNKLAEHSARIAAILELFDDPGAVAIQGDTMLRVVDLATYYAAEAERLNTESRIDPALAAAERLRAWLMDWPHALVSLPDVQRLGPASLRPKAIAEPSVAILLEYGWLIEEGRGEIEGVVRRETFRIFQPRGGR